VRQFLADFFGIAGAIVGRIEQTAGAIEKTFVSKSFSGIGGLKIRKT
jgi:hypothetical protein